MQGVPGVLPEKLAEGMEAKHCALSLVGEPIMYPGKIITLHPLPPSSDSNYVSRYDFSTVFSLVSGSLSCIQIFNLCLLIG